MPSPSAATLQKIIGFATAILFTGVASWLVFRPPSPPPAVPPPVGSERYFTWQVVATSLDPIIVERETALFHSAVNVLRENPDFFDGWMTIGGAKKAVGDFAGAAEIWKHASEIRPQNSVSFNNLADLYANFLADYPRAEAAYRRAIENSAGEEKNAYFYIGLFDLYRYRIGEPSRALATLEEGILANPQSFELVIKAARYAVEIGAREGALRHYQAAIKLQPKDAQLKVEYQKYRSSK